MALHFLGIIQFRIPQFIGQSVGAYAPLISLFILNRFRQKDIVSSVFDQLVINKKYIFLVRDCRIRPDCFIDFLFTFSGINLLVAMLYHQGINTALIFFNPGTDTFTGVALLWGG